MTYKTYNGISPSIQINVLRELPTERYKLVLKRIRNAIAAGRALDVYDDTTPGDKSTSCSWGLCHESKETWPDAEDHIFPVDFEKYGRISHLRLGNERRCPLDSREEATANGCFWTCRVFQAARGELPSKDQVLALYDAVLKRV